MEEPHATVQAPVKPRTIMTAGLLAGFAAAISLLAGIKLGEYQENERFARVRADLRTLAVGLETYYIDNMTYPVCGIGQVDSIDRRVGKSAIPPSATFRMGRVRGDENGFATLTTPIAYMTDYFPDPFAPEVATFRYFNDTNGWIMASVGPDRDAATGGDIGWNGGAAGHASTMLGNSRPLSTRVYDPSTSGAQTGLSPAAWDASTSDPIFRDHGVAAIYTSLVGQPTPYLTVGSPSPGADAFTYDPTNGLGSVGDIYRVKR